MKDPILQLVTAREHFKRDMDFKNADEIRDFLKIIGVKLMDITLQAEDFERCKKLGIDLRKWKVGELWATNYDTFEMGWIDKTKTPKEKRDGGIEKARKFAENFKDYVPHMFEAA